MTTTGPGTLRAHPSQLPTPRGTGSVVRPGVIFDLDGTLVHSEPYWVAGFTTGLAQVLAARGHGTHQLDPAAMARFQGGRVPDTIGAILGWLGLGDRIDGLEAVAITGAVIAYVSAAFVADPAPITGAVSTVRALHAAGVPMAVASSSAASFIDAALDAMDLGAAFPVRVSALPLPAGKPDPSVYRLALDQLGLPATLALAVEDSPVGVFAAVNANLTCLWAQPGQQVPLTPDQLIALGADPGAGVRQVPDIARLVRPVPALSAPLVLAALDELSTAHRR